MIQIKTRGARRLPSLFVLPPCVRGQHYDRRSAPIHRALRLPARQDPRERAFGAEGEEGKMIKVFRSTWRNRWHVYEVDTGGKVWLASFRSARAAYDWANSETKPCR